MADIDALITKAEAKGDELDYIHWLHKWPSCLSSTYSEWHNGQGFCEAAHVRRVKFGAGTAIKPEYMAVPLTKEEHALQHNKGESVFYPPDWWEERAIDYLVKWLNGVNPPEPEEEKAHWKREYIIGSAGHILALWLMFKKFFAAKKDGAVKVTIQRVVKRRSIKQNAAQWSDAIYGYQLEFYSKNPMAFMRDMLANLNLKLQAGKITKDDIHQMNKWLHNEGGSTAKLSTLEMVDYHNRIREHHSTMDGVEFPEIINRGDYYE